MSTDTHAPYTVGIALRLARTQLTPASDSAQRDAEILLAYCLQRPRSYLIAHAEQTLAAEQLGRFHSLVELRRQGTPVAYLTGEQEFWSLPLRVSAAVLVPRPETELLVETALKLLPTGGAARVLDLGTGSGAIALAVAHENPRLQVVATDRSTEALQVAKSNAERLNLRNVEFAAGDWYGALNAGDSFDLIVSNPPYIAAADPALNSVGVRAEPRSALTPGPSGLEALDIIVSQAPRHLLPGGWLLLEHGADQAAAVAALLSRQGFSTIHSLQDLAGRDRATCGQRAT